MALQSGVGRSGSVWAAGESEAANTLFGLLSQSNLSQVVTVDDDPIVVKAFNLTEGDEVLVEVVDGEGAGRLFAPFCPRGGQEHLRMDRNVLPIAVPGRYRFVLQRSDGAPPALGSVVVRYHKAVLSHEWLSAYMPCGQGGPARDVAGVFVTCGGQPHVAGNAVPTCAEVDAKIDAAVGGLPAPQAVAFRSCAGGLHALDARIPSCGEMQAAIDAAVGALPAPTMAITTGDGLAGQGTAGDPARVRLSADAGNAAVLGADRGVFVPASGASQVDGARWRVSYGAPSQLNIAQIKWYGLGTGSGAPSPNTITDVSTGAASAFTVADGPGYMIDGLGWRTFGVSRSGPYFVSLQAFGRLLNSDPSSYRHGDALQIALMRLAGSAFEAVLKVFPMVPAGDGGGFNVSGAAVLALEAGAQYTLGLFNPVARPGSGLQWDITGSADEVSDAVNLDGTFASKGWHTGGINLDLKSLF